MPTLKYRFAHGCRVSRVLDAESMAIRKIVLEAGN